MAYSVVIDRAAQKILAKLDKTTRKRIAQKIDGLAKNPKPSHCKRLRGTKGDKPFYRIRAGKYRIVYTIREKEVLVLVLHIGHRRDVYEKSPT